ncbi:hypothetical protein [Alkalilimnicola ehrlichii]|uniref:hypothetical protein n=1 Tax=Alkalilimnicola ehrlichii TaxID=351052 RepID=UPI003BA31073
MASAALEITAPPEPYRFEQIHIDVARNASDDFNPFHDSRKWRLIRGNPFAGPIALGFQMECLMEYRVTRLRAEEGYPTPTSGFRNYQFTFADVLRPGEAFSPEVKPTRESQDEAGRPIRTNRVLLRKSGGLALMGTIRDSAAPQCSVARSGLDLVGASPGQLNHAPDRRPLADSGWFLKRKYLMNGNAKNLISASLGDQAWYFDEIEHRINFPDMVPASLISCALLERADSIGFNFYADPMVYTAHHISVDQALARVLRSNDRLHILVDEPEVLTPGGGLHGRAPEQHRHRCLGLLRDGRVLFGAEVLLAPLQAIVGRDQATPRSRPA